MIKSFKHKGLERFFHDGSKAGIIPDQAKKIGLILGVPGRSDQVI